MSQDDASYSEIDRIRGERRKREKGEVRFVSVCLFLIRLLTLFLSKVFLRLFFFRLFFVFTFVCLVLFILFGIPSIFVFVFVGRFVMFRLLVGLRV